MNAGIRFPTSPYLQSSEITANLNALHGAKLFAVY